MTKEQVLGLLKYINSYYRNRFELPNNKDELKAIVVTWHDFLSEIDYSKAQIAVKKLMVEKEWPPTPGEIAREVKKLQAPKEDRLTAGEAWEMVLKAIRKYGVLYGTKEAEASLPRKVLKAVNAIGGLKNIGMSDENDTYFMNQFYRVYNDVSQAIDEYDRLPDGIRREVEALGYAGRPQLESGEEG